MGKKKDYLGPVPKKKHWGFCIEDVSRMFFLNFRTSPIQACFWEKLVVFHPRIVEFSSLSVLPKAPKS